ncbi:hypothetical protein [Ottowia testudinis]|uniref:Uncharacterized protein n=1 Tax=Ottowia testudinis TaxID=2816950 RepID=A0A975H480_9BURK|nr:hypothetical protein [Ottowia testudinis]QTD46579.1 hypothetical protein J1M35_06800 [Ottowia testudinis]
MIYVKTDHGRAALLQRDALSLRERQVMVLCNGVRTVDELVELFGAAVSSDVDALDRRGLLAGQLNHSRPAELEAALAESPRVADAVSQAEVAHPPQSFVASRLDSRLPPPPEPEALPRMSLEELTVLAAVPPLSAAVAPVSEPPAEPAALSEVAAMVNSIDAEQVAVRSPVAAQVYMTQVLMALDNAAAMQLVETHGDVRHEVDILLYLAQGLGQAYAAAGEDVALRVAMRVGRLLPDPELPMLLDCTLDYVPPAFSMLLYEFVLAGRETAA